MKDDNREDKMTNKVDNLLEQIIYCDLRTEIGIDKAKTLIRRALKKQFGDTKKGMIETLLNSTSPGERAPMSYFVQRMKDYRPSDI